MDYYKFEFIAYAKPVGSRRSPAKQGERVDSVSLVIRDSNGYIRNMFTDVAFKEMAREDRDVLAGWLTKSLEGAYLKGVEAQKKRVAAVMGFALPVEGLEGDAG